MRNFLILAVLTRICYSQEDLECSKFSACESCAGIVDRDVSCRWCLSSNSCVPSKYMCHPWKTVIHQINCPIRELPTTYNDTFDRNEIAYYVLAANRVNPTSPVGAPLSCLLKLQSNIELLYEIVVKVPLDGSTIGYMIGVNHDRKHIFIGFRSTNNLTQLFAQFYNYMLAWMEDFPLGGKMVAFYVKAYKLIIEDGFDEKLNMVMDRFPFYTILLTGHSMGGALATVFSLHIAVKNPSKRVTLHSWSAPRSGDETFVKLLKEHLFEEFRVVRDGDFIPDMPLRISQTLQIAHHNNFEIFYKSDMTNGTYEICDQPETEYCIKGSWWKKPSSHAFLFDQSYINHPFLGYCD